MADNDNLGAPPKKRNSYYGQGRTGIGMSSSQKGSWGGTQSEADGYFDGAETYGPQATLGNGGTGTWLGANGQSMSRHELPLNEGAMFPDAPATPNPLSLPSGNKPGGNAA